MTDILSKVHMIMAEFFTQIELGLYLHHSRNIGDGIPNLQAQLHGKGWE